MEKEAGVALAQLAFVGLPRPAPFTVGEEMILGRLHVGVTRFALGDWLGEKIEGFCPSIIAGPVSAIGDWIGDMVGGVLAPYFGRQPDCATQYAREIRRRWTDLGVQATQLLLDQFDSRVSMLKQDTANHLKALDDTRLAGDEERRLRENLQKSLDETLQILQSILGGSTKCETKRR
jgi:hypothetical protein